ncbi:unnamed protein product [Citrullus colocynthis]|uniref:Protein kinase domain-containing protein n=1 Tax=Citrullus colocynthis TaxID=252529 RepID=A0ABP0Z5T1_9ROSI
MTPFCIEAHNDVVLGPNDILCGYRKSIFFTRATVLPQAFSCCQNRAPYRQNRAPSVVVIVCYVTITVLNKNRRSDNGIYTAHSCKTIAKDKLMTVDDVRSVKLEIEIMSRLSGHPNVLEKHGRFSESDARVIFRHLIQVVKYYHENGVVHRDLKPENILLATTSSLHLQLIVGRFGLATYIKPGVVLYILLGGMPLFLGNTKSRIFEDARAADLRFPSDLWDHVSNICKRLDHPDALLGYHQKRLTAKYLQKYLC